MQTLKDQGLVLYELYSKPQRYVLHGILFFHSCPFLQMLRIPFSLISFTRESSIEKRFLFCAFAPLPAAGRFEVKIILILTLILKI